MSDSPPQDQIQEADSNADAGRRPVPKHWIALGIIVIAHASFNACIFPNLHRANSPSSLIATGIIISQPALIAVWVALASQRFYQRFLWGVLLFIVASFTVELVAVLGQRGPLGVYAPIELTLFILATVILMLVRRLLRFSIIRSHAKYLGSDYQENQFGIKHLVILTTITAIAFGLFRTLFLIHPQFYSPSLSEFSIIICEIAILLFPTVLITWLVLAFHKNMASSIFSAIILLCITNVLAYLFFTSFERSPDKIEIIFFVQLGAGLSALLTTLVIRFCGYRMIQARNQDRAYR